MCGICGQYNFKGQTPVSRDTIKRMADTLVHRGPDDEGFFLSQCIGLGFRRLSIIDLQGGHQPMSDNVESVWLVFNGEIYNFPELRKELEDLGHIFRTNSDTEVIIHGYKQWDIDVFNHLNGMFGLAIWDVNRKRLVLARDPMGIKLLYYQIESDCIYFGSEVRAVIAGVGTKPEVEPISLNLFLRYRYTPSPFTMFKGIKKLAPGTMLIVENGSCTVKRWYNFRPSPFSPMINNNQAKEELLGLYKKAVKRHLISDVPLGLLLSGGIDSGLLLGLMNLFGNSWPTYTIGYGKSFKDDEIIEASETAKVFSAENVSTRISRETFESTLPKIVSFLEEPVASSSIVPMYFVCERARQDVKVALVGQGPDELFGGYLRHLGVRYGTFWRDLPDIVRIPLTRLSKSFPRSESLKRGVYSLATQNRMKRYQQVFSIAPEETVDTLFQDGLIPSNSGDKILDCWADLEILMEATDELGGFNFLEIRSSLPDELLMYADKLSMVHSLEVRVPYLDKEVVEFSQRLKADLKVRNGKRKWLHRQVCKGFLPQKIIKRKKRGFAVNVVDDWFHSSLSGKMNRYLLESESLMYEFLRPNVVQRLWNDHRSGRENNHKILFSLIVFEEWLRSIRH